MKNKRLTLACNRQVWHGFHLQRGHVFGVVNGVPYVYSGGLSPNPPTRLYLYRRIENPNVDRWGKISVEAKSDLGQRILAAKWEVGGS